MKGEVKTRNEEQRKPGYLDREKIIQYCPDDDSLLYMTYDENGHRIYQCPVCPFTATI